MRGRRSKGGTGERTSIGTDEEPEAQSGGLDELDLFREVHAGREREAARAAERDVAQQALGAALAERDEAVAQHRLDTQTLAGLQPRVDEIDRRMRSVDAAVLAAAGRVQELERLVDREDQKLADQRIVLEDLDRQVDAAREGEAVRTIERDAARQELETVQRQLEEHANQRDEANAARVVELKELESLRVQLGHVTTQRNEFEQELRRAIADAAELSKRLQIVEHEAEQAGRAALGRSGRSSADFHPLFDQLRRLLTDAEMEAAVHADERARLQRHLQQLKGDPQEREPPGTDDQLAQSPPS